MKRVTRTAWLIGGTLSVFLAVLGMFLPVLPTTPFLLLASFCYARSSQRLNHWLRSNRWFGPYLRNYQEGRGMLLLHKIIAISLLWLTIGYVVLTGSAWWLNLILLIIAASVTLHLIKTKTFKPDAQSIGLTPEPQPLEISE